MDYERYLVKKGKTDLLSSLNSLDKDLLNGKLKEFDCKDVNELKDYIIDNFTNLLDSCKDDIFTIMYFDKLLCNENKVFVPAYQEDVENLMVFVYDKGSNYSYYIPTEIKKIIKKLLNL